MDDGYFTSFINLVNRRMMPFPTFDRFSSVSSVWSNPARVWVGGYIVRLDGDANFTRE